MNQKLALVISAAAVFTACSTVSNTSRNPANTEDGGGREQWHGSQGGNQGGGNGNRGGGFSNDNHGGDNHGGENHGGGGGYTNDNHGGGGGGHNQPQTPVQPTRQFPAPGHEYGQGNYQSPHQVHPPVSPVVRNGRAYQPQWNHWHHPDFTRPAYGWQWEHVQAVTCIAQDRYGDQFPVTEDRYSGHWNENLIGSTEDSALDRCHAESYVGETCFFVACSPVYHY